jgi:hypothetical protein
MRLTTVTGIALILSTMIYHAGIVFLWFRAQFGEVLNLPDRDKLLIVAKHSEEYRWGYRLVLIGWIVAALGYVMLTALLRDAGDPIISLLCSVLFLIGIVSAIAFWALHLTVTTLAAEQMSRTATIPEYYKVLEVSALALIGVYQLLGLLATAGFGWALLQTALLPSWVGWVTVGWAVFWAGVHLRKSGLFTPNDTIPLLPMVMPVVIGISLLLK